MNSITHTNVVPNMCQHIGNGLFCAGLVLYHPESKHHIESIRNLLSLGIEVIVFDNSEDKATKENNWISLKQTFYEQLYYLEDAQGNIGLAAAYNQIVNVARKGKFSRGLFLFDQDTDVNETALHHLIESFTILQDHCQLGFVAGYPKRNNGLPYRIRPRPFIQSPKPELIAVDCAPSSFSLIPFTTLITVGEFQEDFFIDHIDMDFCLRCWLHNLPVFIDTRASFLHRVGLGDVTILKRPLFPIASPFRHYYQARNRILSDTRAQVSTVKTIVMTAQRVVVVFIIGIYAGQLFKRLKYTLNGIVDGIMGRGGRNINIR
jgi:rhamnosyltransferase